MSNEEIGRIGIACLIAALGALVEAQLELCSEGLIRRAIFWWLVMVVGCGVILDATNGMPKRRLLLASVIVSSSFIATAAFMSVVDQSGRFCFSAVNEQHPAFFALAGFVWIITIISIYLLSFSRPLLEKILAHASREKTAEQIGFIERTIRAVVGLIAAVTLLLQLG
jgi:hypothetical protein